MLTVKVFVFNSFQENTYLLSDGSKNCILVDPGMNSTSEQTALTEYIEQNGLVLQAMINTHCHIDHILGCNFIKNKYQIPFYIHPEETPILENAVGFGEFFGMQVDIPPAPDSYLNQGDNFTFGNSEIQILHIPGHSPGSIALYSVKDSIILTGDVLFRGSIGRTDLPGGDFQTLINHIKSRLLVLSRNIIVYPGHGPHTTIGDEYDTNPFLN